jgi:tetratricopeptide (TPR) repeat protein
MDPNDAELYNNRGIVYGRLGKYDLALVEFREALEVDPEYSKAHANMGNAFRELGENGLAIAAYARALDFNPDHLTANEGIAWLMATSPNAADRNGVKAVEYAKHACEMSYWKNPNILETLAAAHAESGDFEKAVEWQTKAINLAPIRQHARMLGRLELYRTGKPYRQQSSKRLAQPPKRSN